MTCNDETIIQLLADHYTGELSLPERQRVDTHVARCEDCRATLNLLDVLSGLGDTGAHRSGHLAPEVIADYALHAADWPAAQVMNLRAHLEDCENCSREYALVSGLAEELSEAALRDETKWQRFSLSRWLRRIVAAPALAWTLVLLTLYPTISWFVSHQRQTALDSLTRVTGPVHTLQEARSAPSAPALVTRSDPRALVRLAVAFAAAPRQMTYEYGLTRLPDAVPVEVELISDYATAGMVLILLNTLPLDDADYVLSIRETGPDGEVAWGRTYQLRLITDR